jgi:ketosteroid isomerase-like protein
VSQENVDRVRRSYDAFNTGDLDAWIEEFLDPEIEWQAAREDPDAALHRGHDEIRRYAAQWTEAYEDLRLNPLEVLDAGDRVFSWVHVTGRGRASGMALDMEQAQVGTIRDGKTVRVDEYFDKTEALEAAGLGGRLG